jgi:hypothetical protein
MDIMIAQTLYYTMYGKCKTVHATPTVESKNEETVDYDTPITTNQKVPLSVPPPPSSSYFHKFLWSR